MNFKEELRDINKEKIILVDKSSSINSVKRKLLLNYGLLLRTKITTIDQLARQMSDLSLKKQNLSLISDESARFIIESIMNGDCVKAEIFKKDIITLNTYGSVYTVLLDFKKAGISPDMIEGGNEKIEELKEIYKLYEIQLKKNRFVDGADILKLTYPKLNADFYIYENAKLTPLESGFLNQISNGYSVLGLFNPPNIKRPLKQILSSDIKYDYKVNSMGYLYDEKVNPDDFRIFKAYGYNNEVLWVYRDILGKKLPFDQCQILYIGSDYTDYIQNAASYFNANTTIQEGLKLDNTKAYFFLSQIIWYISKGSLLSELKPLFLSGVIDFGLERQDLLRTNKEAYEMLLAANITSGANDLLHRIDFLHNSHSKAYLESESYQLQLEMYTKVREFLVLLADLENRSQSTDKWLLILRDILELYFLKSDDDAMEIKEELIKTIENYVEGPCSYENVEEKWLYEIELRLKASRVKMEKAEEGKIHACSYNNTQFLNRENTYVIGLDAKHFPDPSSEDAVLYDREKAGISKLLSSSPEKTDTHFKLVQVLSSASGNLTLSYSFYDTDKVREINPSAFMGKLLEIKEAIQVGFIAGEKNNRFSMMDELIFNPHEILTDDNINKDDTSLKPINIGERVFSATEIEKLISCRRAHYYQYIVGLEEERQVVLGYDGWLDFMERGSLVHSIFEKVVKGLQTKPSDIDELINKVVFEEFEKVKKDNPVLVENYFTFFREKLLLAVGLYMESYYKSLQSGQIKSSDTEIVISRSSPVKINIVSGEDEIMINLAARIDRVDFLDNDMVDIVDYKSGKCFKDPKGKTEVFQDYLYSLAGDKFFDKIVNDARYDFPLDGGDKKTWSVNTFKDHDEIKEQKASMIYEALRSLESGDISKTSNKNDCKYCPFIMICRSPMEVEE